MKLRRLHHGAIVVVAGIVMAGQAVADSGLPFVTIPKDAVLSPTCARAFEEATKLLVQADACTADSDCERDLNSCVAIGKNEAASEYKKRIKILLLECGAVITSANCGATVPVCEKNACKVRPFRKKK